MKTKDAAKTKKNKNKNGIFSRNIYPITSAVIAAVIMLFAYIAWKFFPFGNNIILRMDLYHQYAPLFAELYERVFGGHSLMYSFTSGLGSCFLGNYFNYLSSPTMLFVLIFGHKNVPEAVAAMVLVKAAASAYTFTYFLGKVTKKSNISASAFGLLYAFCGYFIAYYWNIMWLDAVVVFPLVILGIWYIIEEGRSLPYVVSLAYVMITNYYMAYMTCILSVIFFLYFYFSKRHINEKFYPNAVLKSKYKHSGGAKIFNSVFIVRGVNFAAASILAALIAAFALLPVFFILQNSSATNSNFPSSFSSYFSVFDFLANHLAGVAPTIRSSGDAVYPNVYCGIITLMLVPLYMFSNKFSIREKISVTVVTAVFFFSFNINILNYIWHGFHFPNDLPYRFSFAYSFFLLYLSYQVLVKIDTVPSKSVLASACGVAAFAAIVEKVGSANVDLKVVWTSIIFAIVYAVVLVFMKNPKYVKSSISILLITCVCAELLISDTPNYKVTQTKEAYTDSYDDTKNVVDYVKEREGEDSFYRMELATLLTRMDNCWFFYPGVSTFSSMAYEDVAHLQDYLGLYGNKINSYTYNCQTGLYNSMMSLKYIVDNHDYVGTDTYKPRMDGNFLYTKVYEYNDMTVYENNYWLPAAFSANDNLDTAWAYDDNNPFVVQNDFYYLASGVADILSPVEGVVSDTTNIESVDDAKVSSGSFNLYRENTSEKSSEIIFKYTIPKTQNVYVYINCSDIDGALISAKGFSYNQMIDGKGYVVDVGEVEGGTDLYITYSLKEDAITTSVNQYVYTMDQDKFVKAYDTITENGVLDVTENSESYIKGTVNLASGKMLCTSIPYDTAWTVYVDGEVLPDENIVKVGDALMGLKLEAGEHTIEFKYMAKGFVPGIIATAIGLFILILFTLLKKKKKFIFGESFTNDYMRLGRWRDASLEAQLAEEAAAEEEKMNAMLESAQKDEMITSQADESWEAALKEAENYARGKNMPENGAPDEPPQNISEEDAPTGGETAPETEENGGSVFDSESLDSVLDEFEKNTEDIENPKKNKISAEDKKSAQKKRLNLAVFVIILAIAVIAGAIIMIYAAKNSDKEPEPLASIDSANAVVSEAPSEEDSSELTTVVTTTPAAPTTAPPTETTTAATTAAPTSAPTTAAPTTAAPVTEGYTGAYQEYTVKSGDNFYAILRSFGIPDTPANVQVMCSFNGLSVNAGLSVGQVIKVPTDLS